MFGNCPRCGSSRVVIAYRSFSVSFQKRRRCKDCGAVWKAAGKAAGERIMITKWRLRTSRSFFIVGIPCLIIGIICILLFDYIRVSWLVPLLLIGVCVGLFGFYAIFVGINILVQGGISIMPGSITTYYCPICKNQIIQLPDPGSYLTCDKCGNRIRRA